MNRLRASALWCWVGLTVLPACAGYRDLARELDDYQPSPFYRSNATPRTSEMAQEAPVEDAFQHQVKALQEAKTDWEKALEIERAPGAFFSPEPGLVRALRDTAGDAAKAAETLAAGFDLEHLVTLALLRNRGVRAAADNLRAALQQYNQAWNLDEILRQYSAFTEGLMAGVGPMKGREMTEMKFPSVRPGPFMYPKMAKKPPV